VTGEDRLDAEARAVDVALSGGTVSHSQDVRNGDVVGRLRFSTD